MKETFYSIINNGSVDSSVVNRLNDVMKKFGLKFDSRGEEHDFRVDLQKMEHFNPRSTMRDGWESCTLENKETMLTEEPTALAGWRAANIYELIEYCMNIETPDSWVHYSSTICVVPPSGHGNYDCKYFTFTRGHSYLSRNGGGFRFTFHMSGYFQPHRRRMADVRYLYVKDN